MQQDTDGDGAGNMCQKPENGVEGLTAVPVHTQLEENPPVRFVRIESESRRTRISELNLFNQHGEDYIYRVSGQQFDRSGLLSKVSIRPKKCDGDASWLYDIYYDAFDVVIGGDIVTSITALTDDLRIADYDNVEVKFTSGHCHVDSKLRNTYIDLDLSKLGTASGPIEEGDGVIVGFRLGKVRVGPDKVMVSGYCDSVIYYADEQVGVGTFDLRTVDILKESTGRWSCSLGSEEYRYPFGQASSFGVGQKPQSVAVGYFDDDGYQDLAVANLGSNNVSILLGAGNGSFRAATSLTVGSSPTSVAVGDFNQNGYQDLAVANNGSDNVSILLGAGDGTFIAGASPGVGSGPMSVTVGDFDRNGYQDLAVANSGSDNVSILLGAEDGTFSAAASPGVGSAPYSVVVGYFDGDVYQDLAVANINSHYVSILRGKGDGTFVGATNFSVGPATGSVAVGDFNEDGNQDLAATSLGSDNVSILFGAGDGTFGAATSVSVGAGQSSVAVGDFNGDKDQDLAVATTGSDNHPASILLGAGDGTFGGAIEVQALSGVGNYIAVGDFDGDGDQEDIAVTDWKLGKVWILLGN